ncbi:hypothetical protein Ade02nite_18870 [Paractinoplanes deccanensis]|uniref:HTH cro/C1-type domain-containing protein n=1 Tax=Paractinoplanes deccanensis TaxID=113561 RepID=A0ABQ3XZS1_9ACTN|nr:helix-turn-helix transcriptional regulator [Actinoplanes deccanensis]GID73246.1 hypothetical protein Ade02nite_18870 [Actinoplanes deccanensis]
MSDAATVVRRVIPDEPPKLRKDVYFAACRAKGATTEKDRVRLFGMPRRSVFRYENDEVVPLLSTAQWIASQLDCTVDELWPAA